MTSILTTFHCHNTLNASVTTVTFVCHFCSPHSPYPASDTQNTFTVTFACHFLSSKKSVCPRYSAALCIYCHFLLSQIIFLLAITVTNLCHIFHFPPQNHLHVCDIPSIPTVTLDYRCSFYSSSPQILSVTSIPVTLS